MSRRTGGRMRWSITIVRSLSDSLRFACAELVEFRNIFANDVFIHYVLGRQV